MADKERQSNTMQPEFESQDGFKKPECGSAPLPPELQGIIGDRLKMVYGQLLNEPLPDKFAQLLADLSKTDK